MSPRRDSGELGALSREPSSAGEGAIGTVGSIDPGALGAMVAAAAAGDADALLAAATRALTRVLGDGATCVVLDCNPRIIPVPDLPSAAEEPLDLAAHPEVGAATETGRLVASDDLLTRPPANGHDLAGPTIAVPLVAGERRLGVVLVARKSGGQLPTPPVRASAELLGRLAGLLFAPLAHGEEGLPVAPADAAPSAPVPIVAGPASPTAKSRILIVEDDDGMALALTDALCQHEYQVDCAKSGVEGLRRALQAPPDVVLLDVNLPAGMSGFEAAASLRRAKATRDVPILFFSGAQDLPARVRDVGLEQVDFMPKPFTLDELLTRVQQAIGHERARRRLELAAEHDELTGLGNLRLLRRLLESERARFSRYGHPLSVAMIDVDKLKAVNDTHGHLAGNEALRAVAAVLSRQARDTDLVVRYGGDEFVALLPHTGLADARSFGQRVRAEIEALPHTACGVTVSIGVAALTRPGSDESGEDLLRRADRAAYDSKQSGGNRVSTADDEPQVTER